MGGFSCRFVVLLHLDSVSLLLKRTQKTLKDCHSPGTNPNKKKFKRMLTLDEGGRDKKENKIERERRKKRSFKKTEPRTP